MIAAGLAVAAIMLLGCGAVALRRYARHRSITGAGAAAVSPEAVLAAVAHRLSPTHPVSGLPMRETLLARMRADRAGTFGAIAFTDFDRLSAFDPMLGERVFSIASQRLRAMVAADRVVAQVDRGQIGLWYGAGTADQAHAELDAIAYALGDTIEHEGTRLTPGIKVRLARFDEADGVDAATVVARTLASFSLPDRAVATPERQIDYAALARDRYALEQDLRQAITRREFHLAFQPLIDAGQGCVVGAEALIRWTHPERGAVSPALFIPVVEAMGLASEVGLWALNGALREVRDWHAGGLGQLRVAVNVSALQLEREDLPVLVQRTLHRHDLPAAALEIELTESVATSDAAHCRHIFDALRRLGVKLAVDDFGTGYSGFSSLRKLAFDKIKIDREFVTDVDQRRDSQAICQSIIALGRGLGIRVLAEGVERQGEYDWLRRHGCQHFQGYYFARPLAPADFAAFVRDPSRLAALLRPPAHPASIAERLSA